MNPALSSLIDLLTPEALGDDRVRTTQAGGKVAFELLASFVRPEGGPVDQIDPPADFDDLPEWLFVDQSPVITARSRGLARAHIWNTSGELVASITQEALLRMPDGAS